MSQNEDKQQDFFRIELNPKNSPNKVNSGNFYHQKFSSLNKEREGKNVRIPHIDVKVNQVIPEMPNLKFNQESEQSFREQKPLFAKNLIQQKDGQKLENIQMNIIKIQSHNFLNQSSQKLPHVISFEIQINQHHSIQLNRIVDKQTPKQKPKFNFPQEFALIEDLREQLNEGEVERDLAKKLRVNDSGAKIFPEDIQVLKKQSQKRQSDLGSNLADFQLNLPGGGNQSSNGKKIVSGEESLEQTSPATRFFVNHKKKIAVVALILIAIGILLIIGAVKCWYPNGLCPTRPPECLVNCDLKPVFMVDPQERFRENECMQYNYTVSNEMQNRKSKEQYVAVFCVRKVTKSTIQFLSSIQKWREQSTDNNKSVQYNISYNKFFFQQSSKYDQNNLNTNDEEEDTTDDQQDFGTQTSTLDLTDDDSIDPKYKPINQPTQTLSSTLEWTHPIYGFSIYKNGTINWLSFPKKGDPHIKTLLKAFIQAFAPLIDASLYETDQNQTSVKKHQRLLQLMNETNGNNENNVLYSSNTDENNNIELKSQEIDLVSNEGQHTEAVAERSSVFSDNGTMLQAKADAQTSLISESTEESTDFGTMNMNQINFRADTSIQLKYIFTKQTTDENLQGIITLASSNQTLNFTLLAFEEYLSTSNPVDNQNATAYDSQPNQNLTRLLYEAEDGSIRLAKFIEKEFYIIKVKPIGVQVSYKVYVEISIRMREDTKNPLKKIPYFNLEVGSVLVVGPLLKQKIPFVSQQKELPPLSLGYTLGQVQQVLSFLKPSFITSIVDMFKDVLEGDIDQLLFLKSSNLNGFLDKLLAEVIEEYDLMDPYNVIKKVVALIKQVKNGIEDKSVNEIINIKKPILEDLASEIENYCEANFPNAVGAFNDFKNGIQQYKDQGNQVFESGYNSFMGNKSDFINAAKALIPSELQELFNEEMRKAFPIVQTLRYVQTGIQNYSNLFNQNYYTHATTLYTESQTLLTSYLSKTQENLTLGYVSHLQQIQTTFKAELKNLSDAFDGFIRSVDDTVKTQYTVIATSSELTSTDWLSFFTNYFIRLSNQANTVARYPVGSCCDQDFWGRCNYRNPVQHQIRTEPQIYGAFRTGSEGTITNIINVTSLFIQQVKSTFNNDSMLVKDKIDKLKQLADTLVGTDLGLVKQEVNNRINNALYLIRERCEIEEWPLNNYYDSFLYFRSKVEEFETAVKTLLQRVERFNVDFTVEDYEKLERVVAFSAEAIDVNGTIDTFLAEGYGAYRNLTQYKKSYRIQEFLDPLKTKIESYTDLYSQIKNKIEIFCTTDSDFKTNTTKIRKNLSSKVTESNELRTNLSSKPYANHIATLSTNLQQVSTILFSRFDKIPFCTYSNDVIHLVNETTVPLIREFREVQLQYVDFNEIWTRSINNFTAMTKQTLSIVSGFYNLRNLFQYEKYIMKANDYTLQVRDLFMKCTRKMAAVREGVTEKISSMNYTQYFPQQNLQALVKPFRQLFVIILRQLQFSIHFDNVFLEAQEKYQQSLEIILELSFDIIELVVTGRYIKKEIQQTISDFEVGLPQVKSNLTALFNELAGLSERFTADQLSSISSRLENIGSLIEEGVFPELQLIIPSLLDEFTNNINIQKQEYLQLYHANLDTFKGYMQYLNGTQADVIQRIKSITGNVNRILNSLKLADFTKISELGKGILKKFGNFDDQLQKELSHLLQLESIIGGNFEKLFGVTEIIHQTFQNIQSQYQNTTQSIQQQINSTLGNLDQTFLNDFKALSLYQDITALETQMLVNFLPIRELVNATIDRIEIEFGVLTEEFKSKLLQLSRIKEEFRYMKQSVSKRLASINQNFKNATKGFTNIKNLLFSVLKEDLDQYIMKQLDDVFVEVDLLIESDLKNISSYLQKTLPSQVAFLTESLDEVIDVYHDVKVQRIKIQDKIIATVERLQQAIHSQLFDKFSNLKQAQLYLKGKLDDFVDQGAVMLYQQNLYNRSIPLVKVIIPIPVIIGVFYVQFNLNYTLGAAFAIGLINYRDLDSNVTFGAALVVEASFSWGIKYILEIGVFVRGPLLGAQLKPRILVQNLIPIQLIKFITNVPEISNKNAVKVYVELNFVLYALELEIGFFFTHFWIEIIWLRIKFCIRIFRKKFCISFRIPIGIMFRPKRWEFGIPFKGIRQEFRLARIKLLQIGY